VADVEVIRVAQEKGASPYVGDGLNRWPGVHRLDAARLYRMALEKGSGGGRYHGVDDEGVPTREIAETIGQRLNLSVVAKSREEASAHFGWIGHFFAMEGPRQAYRREHNWGGDRFNRG
jgi:nucleoside-diphosphate-sugar epimerase